MAFVNDTTHRNALNEEIFVIYITPSCSYALACGHDVEPQFLSVPVPASTTRLAAHVE